MHAEGRCKSLVSFHVAFMDDDFMDFDFVDLVR